MQQIEAAVELALEVAQRVVARDEGTPQGEWIRVGRDVAGYGAAGELEAARLDGIKNPFQMKQGEKLFVVRKYVKANSAAEALRKERRIKPDDCWIDDEWRKANIEESSGKEMGFRLKKNQKKSK